MAPAGLFDSAQRGTESWSEERFAELGSVTLCHQELGDPTGEPILLVMGLGTQMIHWEDGFCELLAAEGFRVIRFDNRDVGHSSRVEAAVPTRLAMFSGVRRSVAYTLDDLADDTAGLLDALGLDSAHVVGASMGGMIAQVLAYRSPERVRSLGLIMTGSGKRILSIPRLRALESSGRSARRSFPGTTSAFASSRWPRMTGATTGPGWPASCMRSPRRAIACRGCAQCARRPW